MKNSAKLFFVFGFVIGLMAILIVPLSDLFLHDSTGAVSLALLPQPVIAVRIGCTKQNPRATISWKRVNGTDTYTLYRKSPNKRWSKIASNLVTTSYTNTSFPAGAGKYQYQLQATDTTGQMNHSAVINAAIPSCVSSSTRPSSATSGGGPSTPRQMATATSAATSRPTPAASATPTPTPTTSPPPASGSTPAAPTSTPASTPIATPTQTPSPSAASGGDEIAAPPTPESTPTSTTTPAASATPTPTPASRSTSAPTVTSSPTATSSPSSTPIPTTTQTPTPTSSPTPVIADSVNLILNPSLETVSANGDPEHWVHSGWGTNTRTYTYPVPGIDGASAAKVAITSFQSGDAKWYFKDVAVTPGSVYTLSHAYKATVPTQLAARFGTSAGMEYQYLGARGVASTWTNSTINITIPTNATAMTVFHVLFSTGTLEVDRYRLTKNSSSPTPAPVPTAPAPTPTPAPAPTPATSKYVMLNAITWKESQLQSLPLQDISEATYFVLSVDAAGKLLETNPALEAKFVADVKARGKKATFSIAGGAQNIAHITSAVTTNREVFINNIAAHVTQFGYDGVVLDIENTNLPASALPTFINQLRAKLGSAPSIGVYVQHWQIGTVHAELEKAADAISWISPMIYDFTYTLDELKSLILAWLPKVKGDKLKLLAGVAVNYATGLGVEQYREILKWVNEQGLGGVGLWQNTLFTQPWIDAQRAVWPTVK